MALSCPPVIVEDQDWSGPFVWGTSSSWRFTSAGHAALASGLPSRAPGGDSRSEPLIPPWHWEAFLAFPCIVVIGWENSRDGMEDVQSHVSSWDSTSSFWQSCRSSEGVSVSACECVERNNGCLQGSWQCNGPCFVTLIKMLRFYYARNINNNSGTNTLWRKGCRDESFPVFAKETH